jgi:hypothetical protein
LAFSLLGGGDFLPFLSLGVLHVGPHDFPPPKNARATESFMSPNAMLPGGSNLLFYVRFQWGPYDLLSETHQNVWMRALGM